MKKQIKSKERVANHGEVFTAEREVNAMLDMVKDETERIESTFLEPACGDGNFLIVVLQRKLNVIRKQYGKEQVPYEKALIIAAGSLYGIDIMQDNVDECVERLFKAIKDEYENAFPKTFVHEVEKSVYFVLRKNIVCGDALTMMDGNGKPIIFSEWSNPSNGWIKRAEYEFADIVEPPEYTLFSMGETVDYDKEKKVFIPKSVKEYELINYRRIYEYAE